MTKPLIKNVVFDIGNVFLEFDPEKPFHRLIPDADRAIFASHAKTYSMAAHHRLCIDDRQDNIDAARAFGWHGIRFSYHQDLHNMVHKNYALELR